MRMSVRDASTSGDLITRAVTVRDDDDSSSRERMATEGLAPETVRELQGSISTRLVCVAGIDRGRVFALRTMPVVFGRAHDCTVALRSPDVSRRHAVLAREGDEYVLEDVGSTGGTFVNGMRVTGRLAVAAGDRIQLGLSTVLVLTLHDELEARMRQLEQLESMARVVSRLADDFRNALLVIEAKLDCIDEAVTMDRDRHRAIADAKHAAASATALANKLMNVGGREDPEHQPVGVAGMIEEVIAGARHLVPSNVEISTTVGTDLRVLGSREDCKRVLHNLILNACDAMPHGGKLSIAAQLVQLSREQAASRQLDRAGEYVLIAVADTGVGMNEQTLARLFEPYFTTKPAGHGTGLGLAVVHGIVRRHRGSVLVESTAGCGTTFRIWLPGAAEP